MFRLDTISNEIISIISLHTANSLLASRTSTLATSDRKGQDSYQIFFKGQKGKKIYSSAGAKKIFHVKSE